MTLRTWLMIGAAVALLGGTYFSGDHAGYARRTAEAVAKDLRQANGRLEQAAQDHATSLRLAEAVETAGQRHEARATEIRWRTQTIRDEVPVYVTKESDAQCRVPVGFVQLHDAAAANTPLPATGGDPIAAIIAANAPSGVALSTVAVAVAGNYGDCHTWRNQVVGWQDWYAKVAPVLRPATNAP